MSAGRNALIVVDMQNDFAEPTGSLYVAGGEHLLGAVNDEIASALAEGDFVVYTQDWHPPVTPHFVKDGGIWPVHCVAGSWGAELVEGLRVAGPVVRKGVAGEDGYSGFSTRDPRTGMVQQTELADLLNEHGVEQTVIVGLATDYCVKATALDAMERGYSATVLRSCVRAVDLALGDGERALDELAAHGATLA